MDEKTIARFWAKIDKNGVAPAHVPNIGPCWKWAGCKFKHGYGRFAVTRSGKISRFLAHRVSYELHFGDPGELCVCHKCDNPECCNPEHLFIGTRADNTRDCFEKGRYPRGDDSFPRKHRDRMARGDRHGARLHPETRPRGEKHKSRTMPWVLKRGNDHPGSKLSEDDVRRILTSQEKTADLAHEYGVTWECVKAIRKRLTWRHVVI